MHGSVLIYKPEASEPEVKEYVQPLDLEELKAAIGGGWLEVVPGFSTIEHKGTMRVCVAFCDEEGKLSHRTSGATKQTPDRPNEMATKLWADALQRAGFGPVDFLVGQVAVVIGDGEFMAAL